MRNKIRRYGNLELVAVKGVSDRPYVEFTMADDFVALDREGIIDMIRTLELALLESKGFAAKDTQRKDIVYEI